MSGTATDDLKKAVAAFGELSEAYHKASVAANKLQDLLPRLTFGASFTGSREVASPIIEKDEKKPPARKRKLRDPSLPKPAPSAYLIFGNRNRELVKKQLGESAEAKRIFTELALLWKNLSAEERQPYVEEAKLEKARYQEELEKLQPHVNVEAPTGTVIPEKNVGPSKPSEQPSVIKNGSGFTAVNASRSDKSLKLISQASSDKSEEEGSDVENGLPPPKHHRTSKSVDDKTPAKEKKHHSSSSSSKKKSSHSDKKDKVKEKERKKRRKSEGKSKDVND